MGQIFVARVGPGQTSLVWVWIWKISPKKSNFSIFALRVKKCHRVGSKSTRVSLLFTAGQKFTWVGLGPISTLQYTLQLHTLVSHTVRKYKVKRIVAGYPSKRRLKDDATQQYTPSKV